MQQISLQDGDCDNRAGTHCSTQSIEEESSCRCSILTDRYKDQKCYVRGRVSEMIAITVDTKDKNGKQDDFDKRPEELNLRKMGRRALQLEIT